MNYLPVMAVFGSKTPSENKNYYNENKCLKKKIQEENNNINTRINSTNTIWYLPGHEMVHLFFWTIGPTHILPPHLGVGLSHTRSLL